MRKEIGYGEQIPPFYGVAYWNYPKGIATCYPLGLNLVAMILFDFYIWFKNPKGGAKL